MKRIALCLVILALGATPALLTGCAHCQTTSTATTHVDGKDRMPLLGNPGPHNGN